MKPNSGFGAAIKPLLALLALLCAAPAAHSATIWRDVDYGRPLDFLHEKWGSHDNHYDHSFRNSWNLGKHCRGLKDLCITDIQVFFAFADDQPGRYASSPDGRGGDVPEYVDIRVGGMKLWNNLQVDGHHGQYAFYSMMLDPLTHSSIFEDLSENGRISYSVTLQQMQRDRGHSGWGKEDTYLKVAGIRAWCDPKHVPDGGTSLALLGISLTGLGFLRRKLTA